MIKVNSNCAKLFRTFKSLACQDISFERIEGKERRICIFQFIWMVKKTSSSLGFNKKLLNFD